MRKRIHTDLWEILIPTMMISRHGFHTNPSAVQETHHRDWDRQVAKITKGLTLLPRVRGKWEDSLEHSIPVRIACTADEMKQVADITMEHYNQDAVIYWRVSDSVIIVER